MLDYFVGPRCFQKVDLITFEEKEGERERTYPLPKSQIPS